MFSSTMETDMIEHFEAALAAMSEAEFQAFWAEVQAESAPGPSAEAFIANFAFLPAAIQPTVHYNLDSFDLYASAGEYNFAMAA